MAKYIKIISFFIILFCSILVNGQTQIVVPEPVRPNIAELEKLAVFWQIEHKPTNSTGKTILLETENGDTIQLDDIWLFVNYDDKLEIYQRKKEIDNILENLNFDYVTKVKFKPIEEIQIYGGKPPKDGYLIITTTENFYKQQEKSDTDFDFFDKTDFLIKNKEILSKQNNFKLLRPKFNEQTFHNPQ